MKHLPDSIGEDREYLAQKVPQFEGKNVELLERIGRGFRHNVDELDGEVIKIPKRRGAWRRVILSVAPWLPLKRARTYEESVEEHELAAEYLGPLIPTTVVDPTKDGLYIEEQEKLSGVKPIRKKDMRYPKTRERVMYVLERNKKLIDEKNRSIAFLGKAGVIPSLLHRPTMTNVERTSKGVQVVDFDLLDLTNRADRATYAFNRGSVLRYFEEGSADREKAELLFPRLQPTPRRR